MVGQPATKLVRVLQLYTTAVIVARKKYGCSILSAGRETYERASLYILIPHDSSSFPLQTTNDQYISKSLFVLPGPLAPITFSTSAKRLTGKFWEETHCTSAAYRLVLLADSDPREDSIIVWTTLDLPICLPSWLG